MVTAWSDRGGLGDTAQHTALDITRSDPLRFLSNTYYLKKATLCVQAADLKIKLT